MELLSILEDIRLKQQLKESINLHYDTKHVIHRSVNAPDIKHMEKLKQTVRSQRCLSFLLRIIKHFCCCLFFLSPVVCSVIVTDAAVFPLQHSSIREADYHRVLLCLTSLMKFSFLELPLCKFLPSSSLCPKSLCLSECQELPFGFVCRVLIAN